MRAEGFVRTVRDWHDALARDDALERHGVAIEDKRYSLSLHYRLARDRDAARSAILRAIGALAPAPKTIDGKAVVNLLPRDAPDKGDAVRALIAQNHATTMLYVGDDVTDEKVFALRLPSVLSLRVEPSADSAAALFLNDQGEVLTLLRHIAAHVPPRSTITVTSTGSAPN